MFIQTRLPFGSSLSGQRGQLFTKGKGDLDYISYQRPRVGTGTTWELPGHQLHGRICITACHKPVVFSLPNLVYALHPFNAQDTSTYSQ